MDMYFVDEFVEVVFVTGAEVDERLDGLVGVCGDILALRALDDSEHVIGEDGKICDAVVDIRGFIDTDERFIEDCKEIAEELQGDRLYKSQHLPSGQRKRFVYFLNNTKHHCLISLPCVQLQ